MSAWLVSYGRMPLISLSTSFAFSHLSVWGFHRFSNVQLFCPPFQIKFQDILHSILPTPLVLAEKFSIGDRIYESPAIVVRRFHGSALTSSLAS